MMSSTDGLVLMLQLNILITPSNRACLADFGLAATRDSSKPYTQSAISSTGHANGTLRWQAPELFPSFESTGSTVSHLYNTKATDMYAYAMTVYEVRALPSKCKSQI